MLGREVVERQQLSRSFRQALDTPWGTWPVGFDEQVEGLVGLLTRVGHPDLVQHLFGAWLLPFLGSLSSTLAVLCTQQRCSRVFGKTLR